MELIFGKNSLGRISLILSPGLLAALLIAYFNKPDNLVDILGIVLVVDIVSGIISNATKPTQKAWLKIKITYRYSFIFFHLTLYPILLFVLVDNTTLRNTLALMLLVKTLIFIFGQRKKLIKI